MTVLADGVKRLFVGRPLRSAQLPDTLLPKRLALPIFCSDPISSVAYATEQILLVTGFGGAAYLSMTKPIAGLIVVMLVVVIASYRQTCYAYPSGGGAFIVSLDNLGANAALTAAAALLVDYVMTVVVSVVAGVVAITSAAPSLQRHAVGLSVVFVVLITLVNLRGVRESGKAFAVPTYGFIVGVWLLFAFAAGRAVLRWRAAGCRQRARGAAADGAGRRAVHRLPGDARLRVRLHGADRSRSDQQRRARLPQTQEPQRRAHAGDHGRAVGEHVHRDHGTGPGNPRPGVSRRVAVGDQSACAGGLGPRIRPVRAVPGGDSRHPRPCRQHRLQRLPGARLDPRPAQLPAPPVAHPRRPAGVQQRDHPAGRVRRRLDHRLSTRTSTASSSSTSSASSPPSP